MVIMFDMDNLRELVQRSIALMDDWEEGKYFGLILDHRTHRLDLRIMDNMEEDIPCPDCEKKKPRDYD